MYFKNGSGYPTGTYGSFFTLILPVGHCAWLDQACMAGYRSNPQVHGTQ